MKFFIFCCQILGLVSIPFLLYFGSTAEFLITFCFWVLGSCFGGTITYHRLLAHRSWKCPTFLEYLFVMIETIMISGSAISWVAIHREHHRHADTEKDPHSPKFKGLLRMHFFSMMQTPKPKYALDLIRKPFYRVQHKFYIPINLFYAASLYALDPFSLLYAWLVPAALVWQTNSLIVSFSHKDGEPCNNSLVGLITFGEGWHKNHHANPRQKRLHKFDLGGFLIEKIQNFSATFGLIAK